MAGQRDTKAWPYSPNSGTVLKGHPASELPVVLLLLQVETGSSAWLPPPNPASFPSLPQVLVPRALPSGLRHLNLHLRIAFPEHPTCGICVVFFFSFFTLPGCWLRCFICKRGGWFRWAQPSFSSKPTARHCRKERKVTKPHFYFHFSHLVAVWTEPQRCTF